jgi:AhpD family alkylhydroperoxidase
MSRIAKVPLDRWDPELRALTQVDKASALEQGQMRIMAHAPEIAKQVAALGGSFMEHRTLSRRLMEMVRLRIAFHNQCRSCMSVRYSSAIDDGLTESVVCSLERPFEAPDLTEAERAAVRYADLSATDHLSIDESTFDDLRRHFSEAQIVELGMWVAFCVGFGRLLAAWHMVEDLPERSRGENQRFAPWTLEPIVLPG